MYYTNRAKVWSLSRLALVSAGVLSSSGLAFGAISGSVFRDFDLDGVNDSNEPGFAASGMTVTAYDASNSSVGSVAISSDGTYSLPAVDAPVRLEFAGLLINENTTVANLAVNNPVDFCDATPFVVTPCYVNGDQSGTGANNEVLVRVPFNTTATTGVNGYLANANEAGTLWGLAHRRASDQLFAAAAVRRHTGLGPQGLGGIYVIASPDTATSATSFVDLDTAPFNIDFGSLGNNTARNLPSALNLPSIDPDAWAAVGTQGIGDIEISEDGNTLWLVNLNNRSLVKVDVTGGMAPTLASQVEEFPLSAMTGFPTAVQGVIRPWALKIRDGRGYIGAVASAESATSSSDNTNLRGYVLSFDPAAPTVLTTELNFPLQAHGQANSDNTFFNPEDQQWNPWRSNFDLSDFGQVSSGGDEFLSRPVPMLTDIDFVGDDMVIGIADRSSMQMAEQNLLPNAASINDTLYSYQSAGDLLRACRVGSSFVLENAGVCGGVTGFSTNNGDGPGGGEFFDDNGNGVASNHPELALGGVGVHQPTGQSVSIIYDPIATINTQGLRWFSGADGSLVKDYQIFAGGFSKSAGLGDVEFLCEQSPITVGNRLWADLNGNGVQDPGEAGLPNVTITLNCGGVDVTTVTAADDPSTPWDEAGAYYFTNAPGGNAAGVLDFNEAGCTITVDLTDPDLGSFTTVTTGSEANNDRHDNDANTSGVVTFNTGAAGENDYSFDIGLTPDFDFGDAPESYLTSLPGGARHVVVNNLKLGAFDAETDGNPGATASGDGADEDGVIFPSPQGTVIESNATSFVAKVTAMVPASGGMQTPVSDNFSTNSISGGSGWDNNWSTTGTATFNFAGGVLQLRNIDTAGSVSRSFTVDGSAESYALKFSSAVIEGGAGETGFDGFSSVVISNGSANLTEDLQTDAVGSANGNPNQDFDIDISSLIAAGQDTTISVSFVNNAATANASGTEGYDIDDLNVMSVDPVTNATLVGWIDFDRSGTFEASEAQVLNTAGGLVTDGSTENCLEWNPSTSGITTGGTTYARFRYSSDPALTASLPGGVVSDGEVEDYLLTISFKSSTFAGFLADNSSTFGLNDNSTPGVPAVDPFTGDPDTGASNGVTDGNAPADTAGLTDNPDGDAFNNLLEYALCFDPGTGAKVFPDGSRNEGFRLMMNGNDIDAMYSIPTGATDVSYQLQSSTDGQAWNDENSITPTTTENANGTTKVTLPAISGLNTSALILRLRITAVGSSPEVSAVTSPVGYQKPTIRDFCQTYSDPFLAPCVFTGTVASSSGQDVTFIDSTETSDLSSVLEVGRNYYLEVVGGTGLGNIFDVSSFADATTSPDVPSTVTLWTQTVAGICSLDAPFNTLASVPDLSGSQVVIREHMTLSELFPPNEFVAGTDIDDSALLIRYDRTDASLEYYWLDANNGSPRWIVSDGGGLGDDVILPPGEGIFTHNETPAVPFQLMQVGEVRTTQLVVPLKEGHNFVASAHPLVTQLADAFAATAVVTDPANGDSVQSSSIVPVASATAPVTMTTDGITGFVTTTTLNSPVTPFSASRLLNADGTGGKFTFIGNGARSLADQIQPWRDDEVNLVADAHQCYEQLFYLRSPGGEVDQWSKGGTASPVQMDTISLFIPTRSNFYCVQGDKLNYYIPSPISNN